MINFCSPSNHYKAMHGEVTPRAPNYYDLTLSFESTRFTFATVLANATAFLA